MSSDAIKGGLEKARMSLEEKHSDDKFLLEAIESIRRIELTLEDPSNESIKNIIPVFSALKEGVGMFEELAPGLDEILNLYMAWAEGKFMESTYVVDGSVEMTPIDSDGYILDIGGGGEGIIGKLNGRQVVAIDLHEQELAETDDEALKIVMDATDLKFMPETFEAATSFFTMLYLDPETQEKAFSEVRRVLKGGGLFHLWDVKKPGDVEGKELFMVRLRVSLPDETVNTGYGVKMDHQDLGHFKDIAEKTGFQVIEHWEKDETFYLKLGKQ